MGCGRLSIAGRRHRFARFCGAVVAVLCLLSGWRASAANVPARLVVPQPPSPRPSAGPEDLAIDSGGRRLCLIYPGSQSIAGIDTRTREPVWHTRLPAPPIALAVDPPTHHLYVAIQSDSAAGDRVVVGDDATGQLLGALPIEAPAPALVLDSQRQRLYALEPSIRKVAAFDMRSGRRLWAQTLRDSPTAAAVDPAEDRLFVASHDAGTLCMLDASSGLTLDSTLVGERPTGLVIDPTTGELFIAEAASGNVGVYGARSLTSVGVIHTRPGATDIAFDPTTGRAFLTEPADGKIEYLDCDARSTLGTVSVGSRPARLAVDPDTGRIFVADAASGSIPVVSTRLPLSTLHLTSTLHLPSAPGSTGEPVASAVPELDVGPQSQNMSVSFSPDGDTIACAGSDGFVRTWCALTGLPRWTAQSVEPFCNAIAFSPDGRLIASGTRRGALEIWDAGTGRRLRVYPTGLGSVHSVAFAPDGVEVALGGDDVGLEVMDLRNAHIRPFPGHDGYVPALAFSPDGKWLASGSNDSTLVVWNPATGRRIGVGRSPLRYASPDPLTDAVQCLAFSPDGEQIATGNQRGDIRIWQRRSVNGFKQLGSGWKLVKEVSWSSDGRFIAASGERDDGPAAAIYDLKTGSVRFLPGVGLAGGFSPDGRVLGLSDPYNRLTLLDLHTGSRRAMWGGEVPAESTALSPDGSLAAIARDRFVEIWSLQTGILQRVLRDCATQVCSLAFSSDGRCLACGDVGGRVRLYSLPSGRLLKTLTGYDDTVSSLAFLPGLPGLPGFPGQRLLLSGGDDARLIFWNLDSGRAVRKLTLPRMSTNGYMIALSPDGKSIAASDGQWASAYRLADGKRLWLINTGWLARPSFTPDGRQVVLADNNAAITIHDAITGRQLAGIMPPWTWWTAVACSPDGKAIAVGTAAKEIGLFAMQTGTSRWRRIDARGPITAIQFTPDGRRVIASSVDGGTRIYDTQTGRLLTTLYGFSSSGMAVPDNAYLSITPEGYYEGSISIERFVHFGVDGGLFPAACFHPQYDRPDLVRAALAGQPLAAPVLRGPHPPRCQFILPTTGARTPDGRLLVAVQAVDDSAVKRVEITINGVPVTADPVAMGGPANDARPLEIGARPYFIAARPLEIAARPLEIAARSRTNSLLTSYRARDTYFSTVRIPPGVRSVLLQAVAIDDDGLRSRPVSLALTRADEAPAPGRLLGLCVGISHYMDSRLDLRCAALDADALADALRRQTGIYQTIDVKSLLDEDATETALMASLEKIDAETRPSDTVILFLSGHGWVTPAGNFAFATYDVTARSRSGVEWTKVIDVIRRIALRSRRVLLLLDACRSGSSVSSVSNQSLARAVPGSHNSLAILASSRGSEVSLESSEDHHGFFTQALLEALDGKTKMGSRSPEPGPASLLDLFNYVHQRVRQLSSGLQTPTLPFLDDFDTDAPLLEANAKSLNTKHTKDDTKDAKKN